MIEESEILPEEPTSPNEPSFSSSSESSERRDNLPNPSQPSGAMPAPTAVSYKNENILLKSFLSQLITSSNPFHRRGTFGE